MGKCEEFADWRNEATRKLWMRVKCKMEEGHGSEMDAETRSKTMKIAKSYF